MLQQSARRCCFCFGINGDFGEKEGQIAHVNRDHSDARLANLAWLCLDHHNRYDSRTSQSKGLTSAELVNYRKKLYEFIAQRRASHELPEPLPLRSRVRELIHKINPEVLRLIDAGQPAIHVMISMLNLLALQQLESETGFSDLLKITPTGATIAGGFGNRIGNALNDVNEGGLLQGFLIQPLPDLSNRGA